MRMVVGNSDGLLARQSRLNLVLSLAHSADDLALCFDGSGSSELPGRKIVRMLDDLEFTGRQASIKVSAHLRESHFAHATAEAVTNQCPFIDDSLAPEVLVAEKSKRLAHAVNGVDRLLLMLKTLACRVDDGFQRQTFLGPYGFGSQDQCLARSCRLNCKAGRRTVSD